MAGPPSALKKVLIAEGFEVYRTSPNQVSLADRVRDNLLMDSGVSVFQGETLQVRVVLRAQASNFPGDSADALYSRARGLSEPLAARGYAEIAAAGVPVQDPSDRSRTLDTWYEVTYSLGLTDEGTLFDELRFALGLTKNFERP
jgi:hypothetical protein